MTDADLPQLRLDALLCFPLYATSRAITRKYAELLAEAGLTYPQYLVMLVLWEAEEPVTVGRIGDRLGLDSGTLTPLLKRLEAAGLVHRHRDPEDERRVLVSLTEPGSDLREQVADVPMRLGLALGVTREEATDLRDRLTVILDRLEGAR